MKRLFLSAAFCALLPLGLQAAQSSSAHQDSEVLAGKASANNVPRLIKHGGVLLDRAGTPRAGTVPILFAIYGEQQGGAPLWQETQNVQPDANGRYAVLLGATRDLPRDIFAANAARWLGVQVLADAEPEQARMLLVSVPYALKAQDADTLGGRPASSYVSSEMLADALGGRAAGSKKTIMQAAALDNPQGAVNVGSYTLNAIPKFTAADNLADSLMFEQYNQAATDAFGGVLANEDVVRVGNGTGLKKRLEIDGRMVAEGFDVTTSVGNSVHVVNTNANGVGFQGNANGIGFSTGFAGTSRGLNGAGMRAFALPPLSLQPQAPGDYTYGVLSGNYHPQGAAINAFSAYDGTALGADFPTLTGAIGLYAGTSHTNSIPAVLDQRGAGGGKILSARTAGTEVISMTSAGNVTATGSVTAASFFGSGAGLTGVNAASATTAATATALAANPSDCTAGQFANAIDAQGNLTCAVSPIYSAGTGLSLSGSQFALDTAYTDGRYLQLAGGTMAGSVLFAPQGTATSGTGFASQPLDLAASSFNSGNGLGYKQTFRFDVEPLNNNTVNYSGRLRLGFANQFFGAPPSPTGISFEKDGTINAVKFVGDGSLLTNVPASSANDLTCVGCVGTTDLADLSVTTAKIADLNVTSGKLAAGAVISTKLGAGAVGNTALADGSVTSAKVQDGSLLNADISLSAAIDPSKISGTAATLSAANVFSSAQTINSDLTLTGSINSGLRIIADPTSPNVIGGHSGNAVTSGYGAAIGGGSSNQVTAIFGVVAGGETNTAGDHSAVGGGFTNSATNGSVVAGGYFNTASGATSTVGGGGGNSATGTSATVPGGQSNTASGSFSFAAGWNATAAHSRSFVWSDGTAFSSTADQQFSVHAQNGVRFITGGLGLPGGISMESSFHTPNLIFGNLYAAPNGNAASIGVSGATISGGGHASSGFGGPNLVTGDFGTVGGGVGNQAAAHATVSGGFKNQATSPYAGVASGQTNTASGSQSFVGGGLLNTASGLRSVVGAGEGNSAGGEDSIVGGGKENSASNIYAAVGGGVFNTASGQYSVVSGGGGNQATAQAAAVGGGSSNVASGTNATIPGGMENAASGSTSFAAGNRAKATHQGSFVWGDSTSSDVNSSASDEFTIRAGGGFRFLDSGNTLRFSISAAGAVTATSFVGDGSGLTGISAGTANDLTCTGCVAPAEVSFNYADSASQGGPASNSLQLGGVAASDYARIGTANTLTALNTFTLIPAGASVGQGPVYVNPASAAANATLLGVAVAGTEKLRIDAEGDVVARSAAFSGAVAVAVDGTASSSGVSTGVKGLSASTSGTGVRGDATASTGQTFGVHGVNSSSDGIGVLGVSNHAGSATAFGVKGSQLGTAGAALYATASNPSGTAIAVHGETVSASGIAGRFDLKANSGTILLARAGSPSLSDKFSVAADGSVTSSGTVTATSFSGSGASLTGVATSAQLSALDARLAVRGINFIAGCDSCNLLQTTDSQKAIYMNVVGAMTVNQVTCISDMGAPTISLQRDDGSVGNILNGDLACSTGGTSTTSFFDSALTVGDKIDFYVTGGTGVAHRVTVVIKATIN